MDGGASSHAVLVQSVLVCHQHATEGEAEAAPAVFELVLGDVLMNGPLQTTAAKAEACSKPNSLATGSADDEIQRVISCSRSLGFRVTASRGCGDDGLCRRA